MAKSNHGRVPDLDRAEPSAGNAQRARLAPVNEQDRCMKGGLRLCLGYVSFAVPALMTCPHHLDETPNRFGPGDVLVTGQCELELPSRRFPERSFDLAKCGLLIIRCHDWCSGTLDCSDGL